MNAGTPMVGVPAASANFNPMGGNGAAYIAPSGGAASGFASLSAGFRELLAQAEKAENRAYNEAQKMESRAYEEAKYQQRKAEERAERLMQITDGNAGFREGMEYLASVSEKVKAGEFSTSDDLLSDFDAWQANNSGMSVDFQDNAFDSVKKSVSALLLDVNDQTRNRANNAILSGAAKAGLSIADNIGNLTEEAIGNGYFDIVRRTASDALPDVVVETSLLDTFTNQYDYLKINDPEAAEKWYRAGKIWQKKMIGKGNIDKMDAVFNNGLKDVVASKDRIEKMQEKENARMEDVVKIEAFTQFSRLETVDAKRAMYANVVAHPEAYKTIMGADGYLNLINTMDQDIESDINMDERERERRERHSASILHEMLPRADAYGSDRLTKEEVMSDGSLTPAHRLRALKAMDAAYGEEGKAIQPLVKDALDHLENILPGQAMWTGFAKNNNKAVLNGDQRATFHVLFARAIREARRSVPGVEDQNEADRDKATLNAIKDTTQDILVNGWKYTPNMQSTVDIETQQGIQAVTVDAPAPNPASYGADDTQFKPEDYNPKDIEDILFKGKQDGISRTLLGAADFDATMLRTDFINFNKSAYLRLPSAAKQVADRIIRKRTKDQYVSTYIMRMEREKYSIPQELVYDPVTGEAVPKPFNGERDPIMGIINVDPVFPHENPGDESWQPDLLLRATPEEEKVFLEDIKRVAPGQAEVKTHWQQHP